jgi:hypothetical protein
MLYRGFFEKEHKINDTSQLLSIVTYPVCYITVVSIANVSPVIQLVYDSPPTGEWVS